MSDYVNNISEGDFEKNVLQSSQPVLVDFWAEWCGPCRMLGPTVEAVAKQYAGSATVVKLNVDESPGVAARYGVRGIPTLILFKGGQEAERVVGAVPKETISRLIDKHVEGRVAS
jgi:thioredoxin 1